MADAAREEPTDGRARRSLRTREAIVDATISLLESGDLRPTGPRVAEAASVSVRSIFQHFDDLETLYAAVAQRVLERFALLIVPVPADAPLEERLPHFVHLRGQLLDAISPLRRAADVHAPFSAELTARLRDGQAFLRTEVEETFGAELDAMGAARTEALDALDAAFSWTTWDGLRVGLGRDVEAAERVLVRLARGVLGG